jgi:hypothetical protein
MVDPEYLKGLLKFDKKKYFADYGKNHFGDETKGEEEIEKSMHQLAYTGYPKPDSDLHRRRFILESFTRPIEESYFWLLNHVTEGNNGYPIVEKIVDIFTSSEQSSFWGQSSTRLGIQQDRVSQYLATIGKMIKDLFQLVRELRILDERLGYYQDSLDVTSKSRESAEITLKGTYVDMAEGGSKNPSSVFGMAREVQFTTLPDLFFSVHPPTARDVDEYVDKLEFNDAVKRVLKRKLRGYMDWKEHTFKELKTRRIFTLKYTRQHYDVIYMYLAWIRPYLRNIARLQSEMMEEKKVTTPDLVSAFEGSLLEVEFLARKLPEGNKKYYSCILASFELRTRPEMSFHQEGYKHTGPVHMGRIEMFLRGYTWTEEDIKAYKQLRDSEDFEMMGKIDLSVKEAMEGLGEELQKYLSEAGEDMLLEKKSKSDAKKTQKNPLAEFLGTFVNIKPKDKKEVKKVDLISDMKEKSKASSETKSAVWTVYKNYKKSHGFLAW